MKMRLALTLGCCLAVLGCTGDDSQTVTASVSDHADALTAAPGDKLATFTVTSASEAYELAPITITVGEAGATALQINFTLNDGNADGKLGEGESLTLVEPGLNKFDDTSVGKTYVVSFRVAVSDGVVRELASETWTPTN